MENYCNKVASFQSKAGTENSYEKRDETQSISEEIQASFDHNTMNVLLKVVR